MANNTALEPGQLARAVAEVQRAPRAYGKLIMASAQSLVPFNCKIGDYSYPAEAMCVPVELLLDGKGNCVFKGLLHVMDDELTWAKDERGLESLFQRRLKTATCISVRVHSRQGNSANVTATFPIDKHAAA
ncbi:hypothetical protein WME94_41760 [Sorangium sp. So ce429]